MTPVAQATNILQAETNVQMGWLLPTVKLLKIKLNRIKLPLKYCKPLVVALQVGIEDRFGPMMEDPELVAASILLPKFKTNWTQEDETIKIGKEKYCMGALCVYFTNFQSRVTHTVQYRSKFGITLNFLLILNGNTHKLVMHRKYSKHTYKQGIMMLG